MIWVWSQKKGVKFPAKSQAKIRYEEKTASGRSHKSTITKLGGGRKCINGVVTDKELWIKPLFPFNLVAVFYDGIHKIPLSRITNVSKTGRTVMVDFQRSNGEPGRFELSLKEPDAFITHIQGNS